MRDTVNACLKYGAKLVFFDNVYMYDKNHLSHLTENTPVNPPSRKGAVREMISGILLEAVQDMPEGVCELMCHPTTRPNGSSLFEQSRPRECYLLTHPDLMDLLRREGGKSLATFAQAFA